MSGKYKTAMHKVKEETIKWTLKQIQNAFFHPFASDFLYLFFIHPLAFFRESAEQIKKYVEITFCSKRKKKLSIKKRESSILLWNRLFTALLFIFKKKIQWKHVRMGMCKLCSPCRLLAHPFTVQYM